MKISRMLAAGELTPLRRGLYLSDRTVEPLALVSAIYGPSYVSFESALAWHGLIPERVEEVVCATLKRPAMFETPVGRYRYRHVPSRVFAIGIRSQKDVRAWLDRMRIEEVPMLDQEQLAACAASYGRPAVRHLARYFQKNPTTP